MTLEFNGRLDDYLLRDNPQDQDDDCEFCDCPVDICACPEPDYESIAADREAARWE